MAITQTGKRVSEKFTELRFTVTGTGSEQTHTFYCKELKNKYCKKLVITLTSAPSSTFPCSLVDSDGADIFTLTGLSNSALTDEDIGSTEGDYGMVVSPLTLAINTSSGSTVVVVLRFVE